MSVETRSVVRVLLLSAFALGIFAITPELAAAQTAWTQTPSPALLISMQDQGKRALAIADPLTMKVVANIPMGATRVHKIAVSPDGRLAYVTVTDFDYERKPGVSKQIPDDYISVVDLAARKELRHIVTGPGSWPFSLALVGGKLYYIAEGYGVVGRYDLASNQIDRMIGIGQMRNHSLAVSKDGEHLFTTNDFSASVTAIGSWDVPANERVPGFVPPYSGSVPYWTTSLIPVGLDPGGIALSPDEKEVWVLDHGDSSLSIIDVATNKVSQTLDLKTKKTTRLAFTPDGKRVFIATSSSLDILVLDAVARKEIKRINLGKEGSAHDVLVSPDGSHVYVAVMGGSNIAIIDVKTLEVSGRISTAAIGAMPDDLAWAVKR